MDFTGRGWGFKDGCLSKGIIRKRRKKKIQNPKKMNYMVVKSTASHFPALQLMGAPVTFGLQFVINCYSCNCYRDLMLLIE